MYLLLEQEDVMTRLVLTYLAPMDLFQCALSCRYFNSVIFQRHSTSSWIFKQLVFSHVKETGLQSSSKEVSGAEILQRYETKIQHLEADFRRQIDQEPSTSGSNWWLELYKSCVTLKFDSKLSLDGKDAHVRFEDMDRVMVTGDSHQVWQSACATLACKLGGIYRWKIQVERFVGADNSFEIVLGICVHNLEASEFSTSHFLVCMDDDNCGMGIILGIREFRTGARHIVPGIPLPDYTTLPCPFTIGFMFDYTVEPKPTLYIYGHDDQLIGRLDPEICELEAPADAIFYPSVSLCRHKTVRILPWL